MNTSPPARFRPTVADDFEAIARLTNTFIENTVIHFGYAPVTADELRAAWRDSGAGQRHPWLTAEIDGRFAGFAKAGVWRTREAYQWTTEVGIYMEESARGRGIGKALYAELLDQAHQRGFESAIGGVTLPNAASVRLHESLGFERVATFARAGWKRGAWHDVGFWQKMLGGGGAPTTAPSTQR